MIYKRRIMAIVCAAALSLNMSAFAQEESGGNSFENDENTVQSLTAAKRKIKALYEDFESYTGGTENLKIPLVLNNAAGESAENELLDAKSLCLKFPETASADPFLYCIYNTTEKFSWKADICFDGAVAGGGFVVVAKNAQGSNVYLQNARFSEGELVLYDSKDEKNRITFEAKKRYSLEYVIDPTTKTFDFYVNNVLAAEGYKFAADFASVNQLRLLASGSEEYHDNVYIDNFTIYKYTAEENLAPEVAWDAADEIDLNAVPALTVKASDKDGEIDKIELYCDGKLIAEKKGAIAVFDCSDISNGEHDIKTIAYDNEGATAYIEKKIKFTRNEKEFISVSTNLLNNEYDISQLDDITVTAEGNAAELEKAALYIDNVLVETNASFKFSKELITTGRHDIKIVIFDSDLNKGIWEKTILFTERGNDIWYENDFSSYSGGNAVSGLRFNVTPGLVYDAQTKEFDSLYGTSIYFTVDKENVKGETADIAVWYSANTNKAFIWKTSMFFETMPENVYFQTVGPNSGGSNVYISNVVIKKGEITVGGKSVKALETGKFYDFEYLIDMENNTYSFAVNGEVIADGLGFSSSEIASINTLRLVTSYKKDTDIAFGVDNVEIGGVVQMPYMTKAEYLDKKTISIEMTNAENVKKTDISVYNASGRFEIEKIRTEGNIIYISMKNEMRNDSVYVVSVLPSILTDGADRYGRSTTCFFKTPRGELGVDEVKFGIKDKKLTAEFVLYNNEDEDRQALLVFNIIKDGKITETLAKSVIIGKNAQSTFEISSSEMYDNSLSAKAFVLNSWQERSAFCNNLFTY